MLVFREPFRYDQEASDSSAGGAEALAETEKPFQVWAGPASVASQMHWEKQSPGACVPSPCRGRWGSGCVYGAEASSWRLSTHEGPFSWQQLGSASCRSPGAGRHHPGLRSFYRCHQQGAPLGQREANHITLGLACCLQSTLGLLPARAHREHTQRHTVRFSLSRTYRIVDPNFSQDPFFVISEKTKISLQEP